MSEGDLDDILYDDTSPDDLFGFEPDMIGLLDAASEEEEVVFDELQCEDCTVIFLVGPAYDYNAEGADKCPRCRKQWQDFMSKVVEFPSPFGRAA